MGDFAKLGLKKDLVTLLHHLKFKESMEVQDAVIPLIFKGKNVVFTSRTGSGKTLAFLLGFISKINKKHDLQMVVLVPTRELCIQVGKEFQKVCGPLGINVGMLYGGRNLPGDYKTTNKKNQILVGTPGRLIQHVNGKTIKVGEVNFLVFDESDQMFDDGFYDDCAYMLERCNSKAQIILASATISERVQEFIDGQIGEYELLKIGSMIPPNIIQEKVFCKICDKNQFLLRFLKNKKFKRALIFVGRKDRSYDVAQFLKKNKFNAASFSGDLEQQERLNHLNLFKEGKIQIMVVTDIAARGLHIKNVDIIINYDAPTRDEFYIHRIGRTGRGDKKGYALTMICPEDEDRFHNIEFEYELKVDLLDESLLETPKME